jgi:predicted secreted Zn-dependent protease
MRIAILISSLAMFLILTSPLALGQVSAGLKANADKNATIRIRTNIRITARNASDLSVIIRERQQEMNQETLNMTDAQRNIYQNQNRVRVAVHSLIAAENLTGGIGRNISLIAREFNNSVQVTIRAEERIQNRNAIVKFFFGGDRQNAEDIEAEVNRNQERIQTLLRLKDQCSCSEEIKSMLQEQIQNMEQEQTRLRQLAESEKSNKGMFGWIFDIFG